MSLIVWGYRIYAHGCDSVWFRTDAESLEECERQAREANERDPSCWREPECKLREELGLRPG